PASILPAARASSGRSGQGRVGEPRATATDPCRGHGSGGARTTSPTAIRQGSQARQATTPGSARVRPPAGLRRAGDGSDRAGLCQSFWPWGVRGGGRRIGGMLIVGDIAGIQDFIFDLPAEERGGQARILRARSFYVQILAEAVAFRIQRALGLARESLLFCAAGKFAIEARGAPDEVSEVIDGERAQLE